MGAEARLQIGKDLLTLAQASRLVAERGFAKQDWSGLPMPIPGLSMVLEPRYKHQGIAEFRWKECYDENGVRQVLGEEQKSEPSEYRRVNSWWNAQYQVTINVAHDKQGRARFYPLFPNRLAFIIRTMEAGCRLAD